jgi:hypothetical protein
MPLSIGADRCIVILIKSLVASSIEFMSVGDLASEYDELAMELR